MLGRLPWLRQQIIAGKHISVHFTYNTQESKDKVRFVIDGNAGDRLQDSLFLDAALDLVTAAVSKSVTVDRGHRFSSGRSEVCFWLQRPENVPSPRGTSGYSKISEMFSKMTPKEKEAAYKEAPRQDPASARPAAPAPPGLSSGQSEPSRQSAPSVTQPSSASTQVAPAHRPLLAGSDSEPIERDSVPFTTETADGSQGIAASPWKSWLASEADH